MGNIMPPPASAGPGTGASWRSLPLPFALTWTRVTLAAILVLTGFLRVVSFGLIGEGNIYYTAAVKSMLESLSNFFFAAAEPGGGVTVDKPPLALWFQTLSASIFGVNGFGVVLPQVIAGLLGVLVLYHLVKRDFGPVAGLVAAFVLAVSPVSIAVDRTNNMDSTLVLTLILAAWAFTKATDTGKLGHLLLAAGLVGIGFNIKMLEAYLPLPAFYALYFLGASLAWRRKIIHLVLATVVLLVISFSWITAVDLMPASQRPYVGSSTTNSELELALGYNGVMRLLGRTAPADITRAEAPAGLFTAGAGDGFNGETGSPGPLRLFREPLVNEASWLLPFALFLAVVLAAGERPRLPLSKNHRAVVLWGGWLLTIVVFFSVSKFFHAYYLATGVPPIAVLTGIGSVRLWEMAQRRPRGVGPLALLAIAGTLAFQFSTVGGYHVVFLGEEIAAIGALVVGLGLLLVYFLRHAVVWRGPALGLLTIAVLITPASWGLLTATNPQQNATMPGAYAGSRNPLARLGAAGYVDLPDESGERVPIGNRGAVTQALAPEIQFLESNTAGVRYLVAVPNALLGAPLVLETGRPVLYIGGFSGSDPIYSAASIAQMVEKGDLRYIIGNSGIVGMQADIGTWVENNCTQVQNANLGPQFSGPSAQSGSSTSGRTGQSSPTPTPGAAPRNPTGNGNRFSGGGSTALYDCRPQ